MRKGNGIVMFAVLAAGLLLASPGAFGADAAAPGHEPIEAISRPSADVTLSYVRPGKIGRVLVEKSQVVKAGTELVKQDDSAELVRLRLLEAQSLDETRIKAAEAQQKQKKVELARLKKAERPPLEIDRAELDVTIAGLSVDLAKLEHDQDKRRYDEAKFEWQRMTLKSPIAGVVEEIFAEEGEAVDKLQPVIRVVKINPLWIDVPVPLKQAKALEMGQVAVVKFEDDGATAAGKINHIASEADAASNTLTIRIEVPNPTGRPAGEHVTVTFPPPKKTRKK